jgi:branched-chain amino acid transport system permease protein
MLEKSESGKKPEFEEEELIVKIHRPIGELLKNLGQKVRKKTKRFFQYQIPSSISNFKSWVKSFRGGISLACLIGVSVIPLIIDRDLYYHTFITAMIFAIFAASWDLLSGVTGQVSFGHAAFFGIGGYSTGALVIYLGWNWELALIAGSVLGVAIGLIVAIPSLRLKGPYLALGSLAFSLLLYELFKMDCIFEVGGQCVKIFGSYGIRNIPHITGYDFQEEFIIILIIMIICGVFMLAIYNSKLGTIFQAIREDEISTEASGINTTKFKLYSFMISALFAGIAGGLYTLHLGNVKPDIFLSLNSFYPIIMAMIGGIATISGAMFGAYFFFVVSEIIVEICSGLLPTEFLVIFADIATFIFAIILLIVVRFTERGLMEPAIKRSKSLWDLLLGK